MLKGEAFLRISVGGVRAESSRIEKSKTLARAAQQAHEAMERRERSQKGGRMTTIGWIAFFLMMWHLDREQEND